MKILKNLSICILDNKFFKYTNKGVKFETIRQTAILENENSVNSNNYKHITELAKQISEEAVRERKELNF